MPDFGIVENTLFVPLLGRIYASENFPHILNDAVAVSLKKKLPPKRKDTNTQTQYTLLANAVRSAHMDRYILEFAERNRCGVIVQLGCGLETSFYRCNTQNIHWYEIDLPPVIAYRSTLLPREKQETYLAADAFSEDWIQKIRSRFPKEPILVTASGLFYYFKEDKVISLLKTLKRYGNIEIVFDAVNRAGLNQMKKYMNQIGHKDALMYFYVNSAKEMGNQIGAALSEEKPYYKNTSKKGLSFATAATMKFADWLKMVKIVSFKLN